MAVDTSVVPEGWFAEQIGACEPDLLRSMAKAMAEEPADRLIGASHHILKAVAALRDTEQPTHRTTGDDGSLPARPRCRPTS